MTIDKLMIAALAAMAMIYGAYHLGERSGDHKAEIIEMKAREKTAKQKAKHDAEIKDMSGRLLCASVGGELQPDGSCK